MKPFEALTELVNEAAAAPQRQETLPYDIRAEIDWVDFSCIANPLGTPSCVKEAIASAISEGDLSFLPNSDGQHLSRVIGRYFEMPPECIMAGTFHDWCYSAGVSSLQRGYSYSSANGLFPFSCKCWS